MILNYKMKNICPVIVGLGYVGLPIFLHLQEHFNTVGFDINKKRIISLKKRKDYNKEFSNKDLKLKKKSIFTNKLKDIKKGNFYIVTVPTPEDKNISPSVKTADVTGGKDHSSTLAKSPPP